MRAQALAIALLAAGCTAPNPGLGGVPPLDAPSLVVASGAQPDSMVGVHREGPLDPQGSDVTLAVNDVQLRVRTTQNGHVAIEQLDLSIADEDVPASAQLPSGAKLRNQRLEATGPLKATVVLSEPDRLVLHASGALQYHTSLVLTDGTLYPLGESSAMGQDLDIQITRTATGVKVTLDTPPNQTCAEIGDLLTLSRCSLFVESEGAVTPIE